jgi:hypothetical protein
MPDEDKGRPGIAGSLKHEQLRQARARREHLLGEPLAADIELVVTERAASGALKPAWVLQFAQEIYLTGYVAGQRSQQPDAPRAPVASQVRLALAQAANTAMSEANRLIDAGRPESDPEVVASTAVGNALVQAAAAIHQAVQDNDLPDPYYNPLREARDG